jgi:superfamily II DNA or RNA helicase
MRNKIQSDAVESIIKNNYQGIIDVAPRVGKSKIAIDSIKKLKKQKILITAPYNSILDSWEEEFRKWKVAKTKRPKVINQRSLDKVDLSKYDLVISDEIHTLSDHQLEQLWGKRVLGFSGSISDKTKKKLQDNLNIQPIFSYTIDQAIKDNIISDYEINIIPCQLDTTRKYIPGGNKKNPFKTTEFANYNYLTSQFNKFKQLAWYNTGKYTPIKYSFASKRADLLYKSDTKILACQKLLKTLNRALIFTARTEVADILGDASYHSKVKEDTLSSFIDGDIDKLAVCEMTSMGITIPDLKTGVFHQLKSSEESAIQKVMRMCNWEDESVATIYIFMYANTQDEIWVRKAIEPFNQEKIYFLNINNL